MAYLEMRNITKRFGRFAANDDVSLLVEKGEIHALLGENGAGKSTLMNILYGLYADYEGEILLNGNVLSMASPREAIEQGVGMVHQHFMLVPPLTVIENVVLGLKDNQMVLDLKKAAKRLEALAEEYGMPVDPWAKVSSLSVGQQQRLEILKALFRGAELLILDEPTAVLTPQETRALFKTIRKMTDNGLTIIFITHKLAEIMELCDRCTVLRLGKVVATVTIAELEDKNALAAMMVGKEVTLELDKEAHAPGEIMLEAKGLSYSDSRGTPRLQDVSFTLRAGEILGVCGVDGNGQSELIRCISGLLRAGGGQVVINGRECTGATPREILAQGVSHIPEDRHKMAVMSDMSINENMILMSFEKEPYTHKKLLDWKWIRRHNEALCHEFDVRYTDLEAPLSSLSGGNQQKVVVARELDRDPKLLIAMHPDRGLDIAATKYIQSRLLAEREKDVAILLVSTELDEIMELSDRIIVMFEGKVMAELTQEQATREALGSLMAGVKEAAP